MPLQSVPTSMTLQQCVAPGGRPCILAIHLLPQAKLHGGAESSGIQQCWTAEPHWQLLTAWVLHRAQ